MKKFIPTLEIKITEEALQALFQGQKVVFDYVGQSLILYPPHYGVFVTYEKMAKIKEAVYMQAMGKVIELLNELE